MFDNIGIETMFFI